ncbi:uncharacterized protein TNIN_67861 [Trichonephila inaurata madagascariensis]|uniref:Uncharacterized protein n=1 Tax=Trichonephila inaurata madagascariensis TaxID=2747483 RepID=A0A8X7C779_9ARAC|nr:uncharacterized protein TNIN_67861 [Trichonephila inaurata madagascariensis]
MNSSNRTDLVKRLRVCTNCLSEFHAVSKCNSKNICFACKQKHHTLLHKYSTPSTDSKADLETLVPHASASQVVNHSELISSSKNARILFHTNGNISIFINTAIVYVKDSKGIRQLLHATFVLHNRVFISSISAEASGLQKEKNKRSDQWFE